MADKINMNQGAKNHTNAEDIIAVKLPIHTSHCLFVIIEFVLPCWSSSGSCGC